MCIDQRALDTDGDQIVFINFSNDPDAARDYTTFLAICKYYLLDTLLKTNKNYRKSHSITVVIKDSTISLLRKKIQKIYFFNVVNILNELALACSGGAESEVDMST